IPARPITRENRPEPGYTLADNNLKKGTILQEPGLIEYLSAGIFAIALIHTFTAKFFEKLSHKYPKHSGMLHILGEVEVVFGFWGGVLIVVMALAAGLDDAMSYAESRNYTEPMFVFA